MDNQFPCQLLVSGQSRGQASFSGGPEEQKIAEIRALLNLARFLLNERHTQSQEALMAKLETIFCAATFGLMNALFFAVAFGSAYPIDHNQHTAIADVVNVMAVPTA